ncbi:TadG family pilus assembly protein [Pseudomonas resinovorans]|uniref:TadG family pilus assembly protein n=1 Tax=Metapseudomonas resinovorans TaxID=53412 RepID=UPI00237F9A45|nr:TadG family pilus assembly protein [Pseudomonas resinovorans]MDE3737417.1 TadG family pilus assembly protein [Pseudomonas resinovorans]
MGSLRYQRGAIGLMAVASLLAFLMMLALSVDAGRLYYEKRKLQRVADMAAMESASGSGFCGPQDSTEAPETALSLAQASAIRHGYAGNLGSGSNRVRVGYVQLDGAGEHRQFVDSSSRIEAVQVHATQNVPASLLLGGLWGNTVTLQADAVAQRPALAGFSLGSGLASLDSQQSAVLNALLGDMLGTNLGLDAVSYQGLADARLNLLELNQNLQGAALDLSAGNVQELLDTQLSLDQVLDATVAAANARETLAVGVRNGLSNLTDVGLGATQVKLADILNVVTPANGGKQALQTDLSVLDMVTALAFLANKANAVDVGLGVNLGLANLGLKVYVIEPPKIAIGLPGRDENGNWRTQVSTAQVRLEVGGQVDVLSLVTVDLGLHLDVAQGWAALQSISCGPILPGTRQVSVLTQPGIASLGLGRYSNIASNTQADPVRVTALPGITGIAVEVSGSASISNGQPTETNFTVSPSELLPQQKRVATQAGEALADGLSELANSLDVDVEVTEDCGLLGLGCLIGGLTKGVIESTLGPTIESTVGSLIPLIGQAVLDPVLKLLGIELGYADVRLVELDTAAPRLML